MYEKGNIIYFTPFYFKNGNPCKNKYFIILKIIENNILLASLPTSKNYLPSNLQNIEGCIKNDEINCFIINPTTIITECDKKFDVTTYIYGHQIDEYIIEEMNNLYKKEKKDFIILGKMKLELFNQLIDCFKNSNTVKRKISKKLFNN